MNVARLDAGRRADQVGRLERALAGASDVAGRNLRECQVAIWKHMTEWCKSSEYAARLSKYRQLMLETR